MLAEHIPQRLVHQMRDRMIAHRAQSRVFIHLGCNRVACANGSAFDHAMMAYDLRLNLQRVFYCKLSAGCLQYTAIADLTA